MINSLHDICCESLLTMSGAVAEKKRLAVLVSGRGSNCEAIIRACAEGGLPGCEVAVVVSNVPSAPALERARALGVTAVSLEGRGRERAEHEAAMTTLLQKFRVDLVCLAGYLRVLSPSFVQQWEGRLINIHPSLLPAFAGLRAQKQALEYGVQFAGCTVHFVSEEVDGGAIIVQHAVEVLDADTVETLSARILEEEHIAYIEGIRRVVSGAYTLRGRRYVYVDPSAQVATGNA